MSRAADTAWLREKPRRLLRLPAVPPRAVLAIVVAVGLLAGGRYLHRPDLFPVRSVMFLGHFGQVDQARLEAAVTPATRGNFFTLDLAAVRARAEQVPWVNHVSVTRTWPAALVVHFTVQQPLAHWTAGGWINSEGTVVHLGGRMLPNGLPELSGPPGSEPQLFSGLDRFTRILAPYGLGVRAISRSARGGWRLVTTDGMTVVMGRNRIDERLRRFLSLLVAIKKGRETSIKRVDLRYGNGVAVTWASGAGTITRGAQ